MANSLLVKPAYMEHLNDKEFYELLRLCCINGVNLAFQFTETAQDRAVSVGYTFVEVPNCINVFKVVRVMESHWGC